jgi:hypothetical protein
MDEALVAVLFARVAQLEEALQPFAACGPAYAMNLDSIGARFK